MSKLGVLIVHGMGTQSTDYANDMIAEVRGRLEKLGRKPNTVRFQTVHWGSVLDGRDDTLYRRLSQDNDLDWSKVRRNIVISGFGDALAYAGPSTGPSLVYDAIHKKLEEGLAQLRDTLDAGPDAPLVIMSHSLGCAIVSNYLWDAQQPDGNGHPMGSDPFCLRSRIARQT